MKWSERRAAPPLSSRRSRTARLGSVVLAGSLGVAIVSGLAGCRDAEQGRPTEFKPGTYIGNPDQPLTEDQRKALRERAARGN